MPEYKAIRNPHSALRNMAMPAEWESQEAIWLSWPHNRETWPVCFGSIPGTFAQIAAAISRFEDVRINAASSLIPGATRLLRRAKADMRRIRFFRHPTDDAWCRDHGPIFVKHARTGKVALIDWEFDTWGGKNPPFDRDNAIPGRIAKALGMRRIRRSMVLEGGSIDVNGKGLLLTTESCLLNPNRNPELSRKQIEQELKQTLGVRRILWLGSGIEGDDTDGHIDDLSRFFAADGILTAVERNQRDANCRPLKENLERLKGFRMPGGRRFRIVELPMPRPSYFRGQRLAASYANFLVINGAVLVPTFRQPKRDAEAVEIIGSCFPGREVIPIDCARLIVGGGTLHCISQQQPA